MVESTKTLQELQRSLPLMHETPKIEDETGEKYYRGFMGDSSKSPLYVTDGHILLLASAIDPAIVIERDEYSYSTKYATEARIAEIWEDAETRDDVRAEFIGVGFCERRPDLDFAFIRDERGRMMVLNAHKLAFCVSAVRPDALTVSVEPIVKMFDTSLSLRRYGELVGLIMPTKFAAEDFPQYDFHGEPVSLR
jgi:hypothetical protein